MSDAETIDRWARGLAAVFDGQMLVAELRSQAADPLPLTGSATMTPNAEAAFLEGMGQQIDCVLFYGR